MAFYFAGFFFLRKLIFADPQNSQKLEPAKFSCYAVWDNTVNRFFKKSKIPFSNLSSIYSAELYLGPKIKKTAWQRPFFLTFFSKAVARELEHIETV